MLLTALKSKIHRAVVTEANLAYEGSITIDRDLCDAAGMLEWEKVDIYNCNNGARFSTYIIYGERGKGTICLNGAAARMAHTGDIVIIAAFGHMTKEELDAYTPIRVMVDAKNQVSAIEAE